MSKKLILFDFDGTITRKDSLSEFFKFLFPNKLQYIYLNFIRSFHYNLLYKFGILNLNQFKKRKIKLFFNNKSYDELRITASYFSKYKLPELIKQSALDTIYLHLNNKDIVYIVSASIDLLLLDWCSTNNLGLITNNIIPSEKCYSGDDCNYYEKVLRISNLLNLDDFDEVWAYGDSEGDACMLELADYKFYKHFI